METNEYLKNLGLENQKIENKGAGSDWDLLKLLDNFKRLNKPKTFEQGERETATYEETIKLEKNVKLKKETDDNIKR